MQPDSRVRRVKSRNGFVLVTTAASLPVIVGMLGLTVDVGRLYTIKTELQTYVDSAAIAAAYELDGTSQGLANATSVAQNGFGGNAFNQWNFGTQTVSSPQVSFARTFAGRYSSSPVVAGGYMFAKVSATQSVPLYFLPILPGVSGTQAVSASAIAGQAVRTSIGNGVSPFSPDAHLPLDPNFGFVAGLLYTLKWPPSGQRKVGNRCAGDAGFLPGGGSSDRGYIDVGQGSGNSQLTQVIVSNDYPNTLPLTVGGGLAMVSGNNSVQSAMNTRFNQDTDRTAGTYASYRGNGRRMMILPVNDNKSPATIVGFAEFFLPPSPCGSKNTNPCCAEYVGPAVFGGAKRGGAINAGLYTVKLFQ